MVDIRPGAIDRRHSAGHHAGAMTISHRVSIGALISALWIVPAVAVAQAGIDTTASVPQRAPLRHCYRGRPAPECDTFVLTEVGAYRVLSSTSRSPAQLPNEPAGSAVADFETHSDFEVGMMRNVGGRSAIGAAMLVGVDGEGERYGAKIRYRRWLRADGMALDAGGGVVLGGRAQLFRASIITTDFALNYRDQLSAVARLEVARGAGQTHTALFAGTRLGSRPGLISAGLSVLTLLALLSLFGRRSD